MSDTFYYVAASLSAVLMFFLGYIIGEIRGHRTACKECLRKLDKILLFQAREGG
jgi:hypothetical protein